MLHAHIFKHPIFKNSSNGGISVGANEVTIVNRTGDDDGSKPSARAPAVLLVPGAGRGTCIAVPAEFIDGVWIPMTYRSGGYVGPMAGGSFIQSSDSRFSSLVERIAGHPFYGAIPLHDRYECLP